MCAAYRILIIDDDPGVHEMIGSMLAPACVPGPSATPSGKVSVGEFAGETSFPTFEIDSAFQGEEGLAKIRSALSAGRPYALAFVDVRLPPGMDGMETISRIWKQCFDLQVVICSGYTDFSWSDLIRRFGHSDRLLILKKPFDITEVRQVAYSLVEKWDLGHQAQSHLERLQRLVSERTEKLQKVNLSLQRKIFQNQQAERRLVTQFDVGRVLAETSLLAEAVTKTFPIICDNLRWDWGGFWRLDTASNTLRLAHHWRRPDSELEMFAEASRDAALGPGSDLPGRVWQGGQPVWIQDLFGLAGVPRADAASADGLHAAAAFPVWIDGQVFGVMEFASHEILERDADQLQTFSVVGSAISQFIERKQAEQERKRMEVQLRHAQKLESIGQLAAGIAHEINTPTQYIGDNIRFLQTSFAELSQNIAQHEKLLRAVKANVATAELIAEMENVARQADVDFLVAEIPRAIDQTLEGVDRVAEIVRAMKDFSHPGTGEKIPVDLNHALETTLTVARNEWKYVADVHTDLDPELPAVPGLPGELNQVILNLIVNAAHAISEVTRGGEGGKGLITLATRRCGEWAEIRIRDTGGGIPQKIRHKIFDPFFTTKPVGKGTGQGLAIAHAAIVDHHGGTLAFETEIGKGTVFIVRLPFQPGAGPKREIRTTPLTTHETDFVRR